MSVVKMLAALLMAAGVVHTLQTQARAETLAKPSVAAEVSGCSWKHAYHYRYHYRAYRPRVFTHPRAPHPRRKVDPNTGVDG